MAEPELPQLRRPQIAAVWAVVALPMGLLAWVAAPWLAGALSGPEPLAQALVMCQVVGLAWQAVLVCVLVRRETGSLRWRAAAPALWLQPPHSPRTGRVGGGVWLVLVPFALLYGLVRLVPPLPHDSDRDLTELLSSGKALLEGSWGWFALLLTMFVLNTAVGEELLFRGYLLPRMRGVFGERDWLANGVLFAAYHLHLPWALPSALLDTLALSYPARRYRSAWLGIAVHSLQSAALTVVVLLVVL